MGLKRDEVAFLAAVSVTWYTWLEQGRDVQATPQVLDAVAAALRLDEDGRRHVRRLGGHPVMETPGQPLLTPALSALVDVQPIPAYVFSPPFDLVYWNRAYAELYADPGQWPESQRNLVWMMFEDPAIRSRLSDWEAAQRSLVSRFRSQSAKYPQIDRFREVVDELAGSSPDFVESWQRHEAGRFSSTVERVVHPTVGTVSVETMLLRSVDPPSLFVTLYRPVDEDSANALDKLTAGSLHSYSGASTS
jgi:transcriptional regulator with XRE-family HTH domain